ncbi:MAG TPA: hypothetical protein VFV81_09570 [Verrucomicrobiae bacterium]|nr:hypothetical protein [Verrucomicrobiae bacterium]
MKSSTVKHCLTMAITCAGLLAFNAFAQDDNDATNADGQGVENFLEKIILTTTTNAPDATGSAMIIAHEKNGVSSGKLVLDIDGLTNGPYTVGVTLESSGTNVLLGTFSTFGSDKDSDANADGSDSNLVFGTGSGIALPDGVTPMDIGMIWVTDTNDNVVVAGDFTDPASAMNAVFNANIKVTPGSADTNAMGHAEAHFHVVKGKVKQDKFLLVAHNLTPNTSLSVVIDGSSAGTVQTTKQGKLMMKKLPGNTSVSSVDQIEFLDGNTNVAFSVNL